MCTSDGVDGFEIYDSTMYNVFPIPIRYYNMVFIHVYPFLSVGSQNKIMKAV